MYSRPHRIIWHRQNDRGAGLPGVGRKSVPELLLVLKVGLTVLLGLILVAILVQAVRRFSDWWNNDGVEDVRGFLSSRPGLRDLLQCLLRRLRPARSRSSDGQTAHPAPVGLGDDVRNLYREFLALGAALGRGRKPPETPREYEARLNGDGTLPGAEEIGLITESYNRVRYAPSALASPGAKPVASALTRLHSL